MNANRLIVTVPKEVFLKIIIKLILNNNKMKNA